MIVMNDKIHATVIARASGSGFDANVDYCISRVTGDGKLLGGVNFTNYNKAMVMMHVAGRGRWLTPRMVWVCFDFPFGYLQVDKIVCTIGSTNHRSIGFCEGFGFHKIYELDGGIPDGSLNFYSMSKDECKWLRLRSRFVRTVNGHGEAAHAIS